MVNSHSYHGDIMPEKMRPPPISKDLYKKVRIRCIEKDISFTKAVEDALNMWLGLALCRHCEGTGKCDCKSCAKSAKAGHLGFEGKVACSVCGGKGEKK